MWVCFKYNVYNSQKITDRMRDCNVDSSAESPTSNTTYDVDTFYEMKQQLLEDRTESKAIEILHKLLCSDMLHIDWYVSDT